jgi:hypothetical protein
MKKKGHMVYQPIRAKCGFIYTFWGYCMSILVENKNEVKFNEISPPCFVLFYLFFVVPKLGLDNVFA